MYIIILPMVSELGVCTSVVVKLQKHDVRCNHVRTSDVTALQRQTDVPRGSPQFHDAQKENLKEVYT